MFCFKVQMNGLKIKQWPNILKLTGWCNATSAGNLFI